MAKTRVYELARELKIESRLILDKIKGIGIAVASHQSTLTEAQVAEIRKALQGEGSSSKSSPKVIRRRRTPAKAKQNDETSKVSPVTDSPSAQSDAPEPAISSSEDNTQELGPLMSSNIDVGDENPSLSLPQKSQHDMNAANDAKSALEGMPVLEGGEAHSTCEAMHETAINGNEAQVDIDTPSTPLDTDVLEKGIVVDTAVGEVSSPASLNELEDKAENKEVAVVETAVEKAENNIKKPSKEGKQRASNEVTEDKKSSLKSAKVDDTKKKAVGDSATIIRRATDEEAAKSRAAAEKSATARKPKYPPRGKPHPKANNNNSASNNTQPYRTSAVASNNSKPVKAPVEPFVEAARPGADLKRGQAGRSGKKKEEVDYESRKSGFVKTKREGFNTRSILSNPDGSFGGERAVTGKKKMVYTPSSQARRSKSRRKELKKTEVTTPRAAYRIVKMGDEITVSELGMQLGVKGTELIKKLVGQGVMVTLNQNIDFDTATLIASDYNFEVQSSKVSIDDLLDRGFKAASGEEIERSPIVTIMGHVDHGKTSILDAIRKAKVADGEAGGITQHIGAYAVETDKGKRIAFLDTPGHEAFTAMRQRGAKVTDIVILVVAADDGVMPQTIEAISHARAANVPIIVAVNKIDKPGVNFDRVYTELAEHGVQSEDWGGDTQFVKVSALEGTGLEDLLDAVSLQAEILELKAKPQGDGRGIVVEGHLEGGRGPVATVMIQDGTLRVGDLIIAGKSVGKVRAMQNDKGQRVGTAGPATPVEIVGLDIVPMAGEPVHKVSDEKLAREIVALRVEQESSTQTSAVATLEALLGRVSDEEKPVVPLIIKGDTQGSVEAIVESITKLNSEKVANKVVHKAVGGITESDVRLAATSGSVLIGFNVRLGRNLTELADRYGVPVKYFSIIYEVVDAVKSLMAGKLPPIQTEVIQGHGEVRQTIKVPKIGMVAGTAILDGKVTRNSCMRLIRDDVVIFTGKIGSLRRFKDDVKEVTHGYECGIGIEGCSDVQEGDVIESFIIEEEVATL